MIMCGHHVGSEHLLRGRQREALGVLHCFLHYEGCWLANEDLLASVFLPHHVSPYNLEYEIVICVCVCVCQCWRSSYRAGVVSGDSLLYSQPHNTGCLVQEGVCVWYFSVDFLPLHLHLRVLSDLQTDYLRSYYSSIFFFIGKKSPT